MWSIENMDFSRNAFSAIAVDDKVYIAGGRNGKNWGQVSSDVEIINVNTLTHNHSCLSQSKATNAVALKNDLIIFFTGYALDKSNFDIITHVPANDQ